MLLLIQIFSKVPAVYAFSNFQQAIIRRSNSHRLGGIGSTGNIGNIGRICRVGSNVSILMTEKSNDELDDEERDLDNLDQEISEFPSDIPDLSWRVAKQRLEEANTRRFLKSRPRFLPYEECRKWVQAWNRWDTKEDWVRWIDEGEKRNSYIPTRPEEYYGRLGKWQGWDHFLGKSNDTNKDSNDFQ